MSEKKLKFEYAPNSSKGSAIPIKLPVASPFSIIRWLLSYVICVDKSPGVWDVVGGFPGLNKSNLLDMCYDTQDEVLPKLSYSFIKRIKAFLHLVMTMLPRFRRSMTVAASSIALRFSLRESSRRD